MKRGFATCQLQISDEQAPVISTTAQAFLCLPERLNTLGGGGGSKVSAKPLRNLLPAPVAQVLTGKEMLMPQVNNDSFLAGSVRYG